MWRISHGTARLPGVLLQELKHALKRCTDLCVARAVAVESVTRALDGKQFMVHARPCQFARHVCGLSIGHVRVLVSVQQESGRVILRYVADGTKALEEGR